MKYHKLCLFVLGLTAVSMTMSGCVKKESVKQATAQSMQGIVVEDEKTAETQNAAEENSIFIEETENDTEEFPEVTETIVFDLPEEETEASEIFEAAEEIPVFEEEFESQEVETESGTMTSGGATIVFSSVEDEEPDSMTVENGMPGMAEVVEIEEETEDITEKETVPEAKEEPSEVAASVIMTEAEKTEDSLSSILFDEEEIMTEAEAEDVIIVPLEAETEEETEETEQNETEEAVPEEASGDMFGPAAALGADTTVIELKDVTINLPDTWADHYSIMNFGDATIFYQKECKEAGAGGHLFTVERFEDTEYESLSNYEILGDNGSETYILEKPIDDQSGNDVENHALYMSMSLDIPTIVKDMEFHNGFKSASEASAVADPSPTVSQIQIGTLGDNPSVSVSGPVAETDNGTTTVAAGSILPRGADSSLSAYSDQLTQEMNAISGNVTDPAVSEAPSSSIGFSDVAAGSTTTVTASTATATGGSTYILPESNTRLYSEAELAGMDDWTLTLARNEIYARHGRKFKTVEIQNYFNTCTWYNGVYEPDEFDAVETQYLSSLEEANVEMIYKYQNSPDLANPNVPGTVNSAGSVGTAAAVPSTGITVNTVPTANSTAVNTSAAGNYILDQSTFTVHTETCDLVNLITPQYYAKAVESIDSLRQKGYLTCDRCITG